MNSEPSEIVDYNRRQVEAARRVLVDLGQVLASFADCMVLIGGWVPDLLLVDATEPHVGSIDVDIALDAARLGNGRYAELLKLLLDTRRYYRGEKDFQLIADVDLADGELPVQVDVEFLAPSQVKLKKNRPKLLDGFRVLQTAACGIAFHDPLELTLSGKTVRGARNTVRLRVASLADFLTMKAHAIAGRDKPKDSYDLCYCLEHVPGGIEVLAEAWRNHRHLKEVGQAIAILQEKFSATDAFGPSQVVEFHNSPDVDTRAMQARRAYELVQKFLGLLRSQDR